MKYALSLICFIVFSLSLSAQRYNTAAGFRVTSGLGLTIQQRVAPQWTIEGIAMTNFFGNSDLIGLAEYHGKIVFQKRLNWYVGGGLHTGGFTDNGISNNTFGMAFVGGIEFTVKRFNLSVDYMPLANFTRPTGVKTFEGTPAISVRYVLIERPRNTLRDKIKDKRDDIKKNKKKKKNGKNGGLRGKIFNN